MIIPTRNVPLRNTLATIVAEGHMSIFASRLRELRRAKGLTQEDLAVRLGTSRSTVAGYEAPSKEREPDLAVVRKIAHLFDVTVDYLTGVSDEPRGPVRRTPDLPGNAFPSGPTVPIRILGVIRAGEPIYADEHIIGYEHVPEEEARGAEHFYLRVTGDSMSGARIEDGDLVYVRRQNCVSGTGDIAVVIVNGHDACLKRLAVQEDKAVLYSDNPAYPPQVYDLKDVQIIGKVVHVKFRPK
jgi:repressor LexA